MEVRASRRLTDGPFPSSVAVYGCLAPRMRYLGVMRSFRLRSKDGTCAAVSNPGNPSVAYGGWFI